MGAASYQKRDGTIVDPIQINSPPFGGDHSYSGPNLEPSANLSDANLMGANLMGANLPGADLKLVVAVPKSHGSDIV